MKIGILILSFLTVAPGQSTGTFTATGNSTTFGLSARATLLPNGQVLITGGVGAELYDPSTGKFTATGNTAGWYSHSSTLLADGRVLLAGGFGSNGAASARAELYDPATATFTPTGQMTTPRIVPKPPNLLKNGKVLFVGGEFIGPPYLADMTAELYDPATGAFTPTGSFLGGGPVGGSATLLSDGRVLVVGTYSGLAALYD
ncbi:MAG TPA: kelch repeat-containing protein, partial [Terriglobales bacterium]|nr:kelch repeat-containing protein [Terriglobales bacterium]